MKLAIEYHWQIHLEAEVVLPATMISFITTNMLFYYIHKKTFSEGVWGPLSLMDRCIVFFSGAPVTNKERALMQPISGTSIKKHKVGGRNQRPPNAFILFSIEWCQKLAVQYPEEKNKDISVR
jgi:hypothetical protein